MPFRSILWYVLDNYEPELDSKCCLLHHWELSSTFDEEIAFTITDQYK